MSLAVEVLVQNSKRVKLTIQKLRKTQNAEDSLTG